MKNVYVRPIKTDPEWMQNDPQRTHPDFWDCECENHYIHEKKTVACSRCGCLQQDGPESIILEIIPENLAINAPSINRTDGTHNTYTQWTLGFQNLDDKLINECEILLKTFHKKLQERYEAYGDITSEMFFLDESTGI